MVSSWISFWDQAFFRFQLGNLVCSWIWETETFGSKNSGSEEKHSALGIQNSETYMFAPGLGKLKRNSGNINGNIRLWEFGIGNVNFVMFTPGLGKLKHSALETEMETSSGSFGGVDIHQKTR
ncbi:hypothetical protein C1645_821860 [Glomus cerebriforme]|uniref:Uncharacterized protein n=1 Tax=Glomus cerebriforme TaxID=658196 RepID=A0A397T2Q8_9GLOM|nr:hypothetical protein C1645_821860 [Glomus cerebriforme]